MSDLSTTSALNSNPTQLPIDWYFDPKIYEIEKKILFDHGPGYVGHELMVPNVGDYHVLDWMNKGKAIVRNQNGIDLLSNVCRHRQALMLNGRGNARNIVCPLHRWTYDMSGKLLGAPHFPGNPCLDLGKTQLQNWNGLLFTGPRDIAKDLANLGVLKDLDFSGYMLDRVQIQPYNFSWKTFIEVYLEDYHVVPFHPGLGHFVNCDELKWEYGDWYSVQTVGIANQLGKPGSPVYQKWHEQVLRYGEGRMPRHGAIWLTYYPNIMVEWYPHVLVVSCVWPTGVDSCVNVVEFYYPEDIALFEREFVEAEQAAYEETAIEDEEICQRMQDGRKALYLRGDNEVGPYQSPMEDGMIHFHEFLRRQIGPHL
jgi:phenylpropionate dioxygenase-like ring-hydroxylating dioxygenase large terminal subunit